MPVEIIYYLVMLTTFVAASTASALSQYFVGGIKVGVIRVRVQIFDIKWSDFLWPKATDAEKVVPMVKKFLILC